MPQSPATPAAGTSLAHPAAPSVQLWAVFAVLMGLLLLSYLVAFDQGAVSQSGMYLHELLHDGRHLLGVPCH